MKIRIITIPSVAMSVASLGEREGIRRTNKLNVTVAKRRIEMEKKELAKTETKALAPAELIELAVNKGTDLDKLEKLLALQEKFEANEARKQYHVAMTAFKADPPKIEKDRKVGYSTSKGNVGYSHASLYNVTEKINSALSKHGLSASWTTQQNGSVSVTCKITHVKGHSESTTLSAPSDKSGSKNDIQAIGSTITYLQRYSLLAITGLATHADDDGQASSSPTEYIDDKQQHQIYDLIASKGANEKKFCKFMKIESIEKLPKNFFHKAIMALEAKRGGVKK